MRKKIDVRFLDKSNWLPVAREIETRLKKAADALPNLDFDTVEEDIQIACEFSTFMRINVRATLEPSEQVKFSKHIYGMGVLVKPIHEQLMKQSAYYRLGRDIEILNREGAPIPPHFK